MNWDKKGLGVFVHRGLSKMIDHRTAWWTKHYPVVLVEGYFLVLSILSQLNFMEGAILCFGQKYSGRFHYKLIHEGHLFWLQEKSYRFSSTRRSEIVTRAIGRRATTSVDHLQCASVLKIACAICTVLTSACLKEIS